MEKQTFTAAQRLQEVNSITAFLAEQLAVPGGVAGSPRGYQEGKNSHGLELWLRLKRASAKEVSQVAFLRPELKRDEPSNCGTAAVNQKQF